MIDLSWNTRGRISRQDYRKAVKRHFLFCLIPIGLGLASGMMAVASAATPALVLISGGLALIASVLLLYYRYRFIQVAVKRLHDRNMSGFTLILGPALLVLLVVGGLVAAVSNPAIAASLAGQNAPLLVLIAIGVILAYTLFLRYQLNKDGLRGPNRYGPPTGTAQAQIF